MSGGNTKMVVFDPASMDDAALAEQKARLERLAAMPDEEIDLSDIPEITEEQWATAFRPGLHRPIKLPITIRIDADVVAWFKDSAPKGRYQTEINRVLRLHMERVAAAKAPSMVAAKAKGGRLLIRARTKDKALPSASQKKRA